MAFFYFLFCWFGVKNNCLCRPQKANQSLHYWPERKWNPILRNYFFAVIYAFSRQNWRQFLSL